jgi:hypothetical protein
LLSSGVEGLAVALRTVKLCQDSLQVYIRCCQSSWCPKDA